MLAQESSVMETSRNHTLLFHYEVINNYTLRIIYSCRHFKIVLYTFENVFYMYQL